MAQIKQQEYFTEEAIEERLRSKLNVGNWKNILPSDLGQALLKFGSYTIHLEANAFFTGLNQMFLSTVDKVGYTEAIAKSRRIIPSTFNSASVVLSIKTNDANSRSYAPMEFSIDFGGTKFYNIEDITIPYVASNFAEIVLYQGVVVREASEVGTISGSSWSYSQMSSPIAISLGKQIIRKYLIVPNNTFISSILIESIINFSIPPAKRWILKDSWFNTSNTTRAYILDKDFLGRYRIVFGDGVYGMSYPVDEIVMLRYLLSDGVDVSVSSISNYIIRYQDFTDITSQFIIGNISSINAGTSEINLDDLKLEIAQKEITRNTLIRKEDYVNYLISRGDVLKANVVVERDANPPNIEYFNTFRYVVKPLSLGMGFNEAEIQSYVAKYGQETVELINEDVDYSFFNVLIRLQALQGYSVGEVIAAVNSVLLNYFSWSNLGFEETISGSRVYNQIKDIEGFDNNNYLISLEAIYSEGQEIIMNHNIGSLIELDFIPKRYKVNVTANEFGSISFVRDNGQGKIYGDYVGEERFSYDNYTIPRCFEIINNVMIMSNGYSDTGRMIQLGNSEGSVSQINFTDEMRVFCWIEKYEMLLTVEIHVGSYKIRTYNMPSDIFNSSSFNYFQLSEEYLPVLGIDNYMEKPIGYSGIYGLCYHKNYLYVVWKMTVGNVRLYRCRVTRTTIDAYDTTYNSGTGYLELTEKEYRGMVVAESIFDNEDVLFLATDGGIDVIRDFNIPDEVYIEPDFFAVSFPTPEYTEPVVFYDVSIDTNNNLYVSYFDLDSKSIIAKLSAIDDTGHCVIKNILDNSLTGVCAIGFVIVNLNLRVYFYDYNEFKVYYVNYDTEDMVPVVRAGDTEDFINSISLMANLDYASKSIEFVKVVTDSKISFESEEDLRYTLFKMPILNEIVVNELE